MHKQQSQAESDSDSEWQSELAQGNRERRKLKRAGGLWLHKHENMKIERFNILSPSSFQPLPAGHCNAGGHHMQHMDVCLFRMFPRDFPQNFHSFMLPAVHTRLGLGIGIRICEDAALRVSNFSSIFHIFPCRWVSVCLAPVGSSLFAGAGAVQ